MISLFLITYNPGNVRHELEAVRGVKRSTSYYPYGVEWGSSSENFKSKAINGMISGGINGLTGGAFSVVGKAVSTSTQAIQSTMSKNIRATATTLSKQGASSDAVNAAVNTITKGMSKAGANTISSMNKSEAAVGTATEVSIKIVEDEYNKRNKRNKLIYD